MKIHPIEVFIPLELGVRRKRFFRGAGSRLSSRRWLGTRSQRIWWRRFLLAFRGSGLSKFWCLGFLRIKRKAGLNLLRWRRMASFLGKRHRLYYGYFCLGLQKNWKNCLQIIFGLGIFIRKKCSKLIWGIILLSWWTLLIGRIVFGKF